MELCQVSTATFDALVHVESKSSCEASAVVCCLQCRASSPQHAELTTVILEAIPSSRPLDDQNTIYLHPLLYEFLTQAAEQLMDALEKPGRQDATTIDVSVAPLLVEGYVQQEAALPQHKKWILSRVGDLVDLPRGCRISLTCIYHENSGSTSEAAFHRQVSLALEGRLIRPNSLLALPTLTGDCMVVITSIAGSAEEGMYRVGGCREFELDLVHAADSSALANNPVQQQSEWERNCSGYDKLLDELVSLSELNGVAAPSGVLLTGCAGVGKSRLVSLHMRV